MVDATSSPASARRLAVFVFFSGACSLLYQVVWQREFRLIFGASTAASGAVLAAFIGGLGAGSLLLAARVERSSNPFRLYARFEAGIALSAALTPLLLAGIREGYVAIGGTLAVGGLLGTVLRVVFSALVICVPTFLMGGTLPAVARAITDEQDTGRRGVALLYGINTLGAVAGSAVATFFLLEALGNRTTLWVGCLVNLLVAVIAHNLSRKLPAVAVDVEAPALSPEAATDGLPRGLVLTAAFIVGGAFFLMELVWFRMLGPLLGGTVYTFGLVLCCALAGIGLGGAAAGRLWRDHPATIEAFALTCLLEALALAVPFGLGDRAAFLTLLLQPLAAQGLGGSVAAWTVVCLGVVFPAAFVSGVQFPLLIALAGKARKQVARHVGQVYAANTIGSVVGSLGGGFGLLPWLSAPRVWNLTAGALMVLGGASLALALRRTPGVRARVLVPGGVALLTMVCLSAEGPTSVWRHTAIGAGRMRADVLLPGALDRWVRAAHRGIVWEKDGVEAAVALEGSDGLAFVVNGKADGNALGDKATQVMSGILGAMLHPAPRKALVIGLGTGSTAGWLAAIPGIELVTVMELEPAILEVARRMPEINQAVLTNPKIRLLMGDARELLATSPEQYDIIFSEPSNPYRAGIANLYTREYYQTARAHLSADGLFIQWLQSYEVDGDVIHGAYATLSAVFGAVDTWYGGFGDMLLIGSAQQIEIDLPRLRSTLASEPYATALRIGWGVDSPEGIFAHHLAGPDFAAWIVAQLHPALNTDDENRIEFGFARAVGHGVLQSTDLTALANQFYKGRPAAPPGLDESLLRLEIWLTQSGGRSRSAARQDPPRTFTPDEAAVAKASTAFNAGALPTTQREWPANAVPRTSYERLVRLAAAFRKGPQERAAEAGLLRPLFPVEVELIEAFAFAGADEARTLEHLERALLAQRTMPWTQSAGLLRNALTLAASPGKSAQWYRRIGVAMSERFAGSSLEAMRVEAYLRVVARTGDAEACAAAYQSIGNNVFWTREHLGVRLACFEARRPDLAEAARRDWERFLAQQPRMVSSGLGSPSASTEGSRDPGEPELDWPDGGVVDR